jgi:ribonuclease HI
MLPRRDASGVVLTRLKATALPIAWIRQRGQRSASDRAAVALDDKHERSASLKGHPLPVSGRADDIVRQTAGIVASPNDLTFGLWTDGARAGNPGGPGGYAAVLVACRADSSIVKQWETSGGEPATTNNRMELMAVVTGLRELPAPARVRIHIDSSYVLYTFTQGRRERWQGNGWRTSARKPVKNRELWEQLFTEVDRHQVEWVKVAGHTGVELNERADQLACAQRDAHDRR